MQGLVFCYDSIAHISESVLGKHESKVEEEESEEVEAQKEEDEGQVQVVTVQQSEETQRKSLYNAACLT